MRDEAVPAVVTVADLTDFFRDALRGAMSDQHITVDEQTEQYLVSMLTTFARAEALFDVTPEGLRVKPLAQMRAEAFEAVSVAERDRTLRRLGDVSLFMAGFFARGFARSLVDVDYHIAMGGQAYGTLATSCERGRRRALAQVFGELANKFGHLVDALAEIGDAAYVYTQRDILRLYEIWLKTGSERARLLLRRLGIEAAPVPLRAQ
jgi:hypothetical protein